MEETRPAPIEGHDRIGGKLDQRAITLLALAQRFQCRLLLEELGLQGLVHLLQAIETLSQILVQFSFPTKSRGLRCYPPSTPK